MSPQSFSLAEPVLNAVYGMLEKAAPQLDDAKAIPQKRLIEQLIVEAFWATCRKEEERNLTFRIAVRSPSDAVDTFEFKQHTKYDTDSLVKLCLAVDGSRHVIG